MDYRIPSKTGDDVMKQVLSVLSALVILLVVGCAANQERSGLVEEVRSDFENLASQPQVEQYAPVEYEAAEKEVQIFNQLVEDGADQIDIEHQAYIARTKIDIAEETARLNEAEEYIAQADQTREDVLLNQREQEMQEALQRAEELEQELTDLKSEQTERGLVLTLDSIVFDVDQAELNPGASLTLDKIAEFLRQYENRNIVIEGFTDSTGPTDYNEQLSQHRAESVRQALVARGIDESRIETRGYGERFPVASNEDPSGRQLNRRVEIVISSGAELVQERTF
jgi:outer membrane protein OmpA-like peptidoglycan-associated protein